MEDDMWAVSSSGSSRSHRSETAFKYQSGFNIDLEEFEEDEDIGVEYPCPFCENYHELVDLCDHINEEHHLEANQGICPICNKRVKIHMVDHITTHHRDVLKKEMSYREDTYSSDRYHQSYLDELPQLANHNHTSKAVVSDPFLSFINNSPLPKETKLVQAEPDVADKNVNKDTPKKEEKGTSSSLLSESEQLEKAKKCEFVQGLLSSAMFGDDDDDFF